MLGNLNVIKLVMVMVMVASADSNISLSDLLFSIIRWKNTSPSVTHAKDTRMEEVLNHWSIYSVSLIHLCYLNVCWTLLRFNTEQCTADDNLTTVRKLINVIIFGLEPNSIISAFIVIKCSAHLDHLFHHGAATCWTSGFFTGRAVTRLSRDGQMPLLTFMI